MSEAPPDSSVERLIQRNRQAIALTRLGISLDLGLGSAAVERLRDINDSLIGNVGTSKSAEALLRQIAAPPRYITVARMLLAVDDPTPVFESIARPELDRRTANDSLRGILTEPMVVAFLAYVGLVLFCWFSVPSIERQYSRDGKVDGAVAIVVIALRQTLPFWAVLVPFLLLMIGWFWKRVGSSWLWHAMPGSRTYHDWLRAESQAIRLAALLAGNIDRETAIAIAASDETNGHRSLGPSLGPSLGRLTANLSERKDGDGVARTLQKIARFYRFLAEERRRALFENVPFFIGLAIASLIVLAYGMTVFLPWVGILSELGQSGGLQ